MLSLTGDPQSTHTWVLQILTASCYPPCSTALKCPRCAQKEESPGLLPGTGLQHVQQRLC